MSSTVSRNENFRAAIRWLEAQFETQARTGVYVAREIIEVHDDHDESCCSCSESLPLTEDSFWWKAPSETVSDGENAWYMEVADEADDGFLADWFYSDSPLPSPAQVFAHGPEYPTGRLASGHGA